MACVCWLRLKTESKNMFGDRLWMICLIWWEGQRRADHEGLWSWEVNAGSSESLNKSGQWASSRAPVQAAGRRLTGTAQSKVQSLNGCKTQVTGAWAGSQVGYVVCVLVERAAIRAERQRESGPIQAQSHRGLLYASRKHVWCRGQINLRNWPAGPSGLEFSRGY